MKQSPSISFRLFLTCSILALGLVAGCQGNTPVPDQPDQQTLEELPPGMTIDEANTLSSLEQIDPYPLYKMVYSVDYDQQTAEISSKYSRKNQEPAWGCSLFAVFGNPEEMLFGRNFDWDFSPGLILYTDPPEGYASVSMVDISYFGFGEERAFGLTELPLPELIDLLDAPYMPFDGMNETGLAVGMATVSSGGMVDDPTKETIDTVMVIRKILDDAATIEEAVEIIKSYNIDMENYLPLHYLIADITGQSVLVEFSGGELKVINNSDPWLQATNFLVSEAGESPEDHCFRYGLISRRLTKKRGALSPKQALRLLEEVAQESTQWSVVYGMSRGEIDIVMGREYDKVHSLNIEAGD